MFVSRAIDIDKVVAKMQLVTENDAANIYNNAHDAGYTFKIWWLQMKNFCIHTRNESFSTFFATSLRVHLKLYHN